MNQTNIQKTISLGVEFWNDSCDLKELGEAVKEGAVGATSNPVIVAAVIQNNQDYWNPVLENLVKEFPQATEDEITWKLIEQVGKEAALLLEPVFNETKGKKGYLCLQVNPKYYNSPEKMITHARELRKVAKNIAIKIPATMAGIEAIESITAEGININATVSFSVSQTIAVAEAVERGLIKAKEKGKDVSNISPYITIMVGRVDDQMRRIAEQESIKIDPEYMSWAGVAVFKHAHKIFQEKGFQSTLLAAAYRNPLQWSELIGKDVILSIPYKWWQKFNTMDSSLERKIETPVEDKILTNLKEHFIDFRRAYDADGMSPSEFVRYGASQNTLHQFLEGYSELVKTIRKVMLK